RAPRSSTSILSATSRLIRGPALVSRAPTRVQIHKQTRSQAHERKEKENVQGQRNIHGDETEEVQRRPQQEEKDALHPVRGFPDTAQRAGHLGFSRQCVLRSQLLERSD